jgi:hypothetical protein
MSPIASTITLACYAAGSLVAGAILLIRRDA